MGLSDLPNMFRLLDIVEKRKIAEKLVLRRENWYILFVILK